LKGGEGKMIISSTKSRGYVKKKNSGDFIYIPVKRVEKLFDWVS